MELLKNCPFCNASDIQWANTDERAQLRCGGCGSLSGLFFYHEEEIASGNGDETERRAIAAWNRRATLNQQGGGAVAEPVAWHAPGLGEVHSADHKQMIYCTVENDDGEELASDVLARQVAETLNAAPPAPQEPDYKAINAQVAQMILRNDREEAVKWAKGLIGNGIDTVKVELAPQEAREPRMRKALDDIYNSGPEGRALVIKHYGINHDYPDAAATAKGEPT